MTAGTPGTAGMVVLPSSLQYSAADVSVTALTPDPKLSVVVSLTVRYPILADVLSSERTAACSAFKTTDVPLSLQSQQRLTLFDLLATACTVAWSMDLDRLVALQSV